MPYKSKKDLPDSIKDNLPPHAEEIYKEAFNSALKQYTDPKKRRGKDDLETVASKVAWAAVKKVYKKDNMSGNWVKKTS